MLLQIFDNSGNIEPIILYIRIGHRGSLEENNLRFGETPIRNEYEWYTSLPDLPDYEIYKKVYV